MIFWLTCIILTGFVGAIVVAPLWRASQSRDTNSDVAVYRAQLAEIARDQDRGVLQPAEAETAKTEVARRLLAADAAATIIAPSAAKPRVGLIVMAGFLLSGLGGYALIGAPGYGDLPLSVRLAQSDEIRANRPSQSALEAAMPPQPTVDIPADYLKTVNELRAIVPTRPDDLKGWQLLAAHEANLNNFSAAATAQNHVITLLGDDATAEDYRQSADLMVMATGGIVSPQAEEASLQARKRDRQNAGANYYLGLLYYQTDRPDLAFKLWRPIVAQGRADDFYASAARAQIVDAAYLSGLSNYTLPPLNGPTLDEIEAAGDLSAQERQEMIETMVGNLSQRLSQDGGSAEDWARLITSYGVLGADAAAKEVWAEAQEVFGAKPNAMVILRQAATNAGIATP